MLFEIINYERFGGTKPKLPRKKSLRGAIMKMKNRINKNYVPRQKETRRVYEKTLKRYAIKRKFRVGLEYGDKRYFSGFRYDDIPTVLLTFYRKLLKEIAKRKTGLVVNSRELKKAISKVRRLRKEELLTDYRFSFWNRRKMYQINNIFKIHYSFSK